jgi:hypothetical protein
MRNRLGMGSTRYQQTHMTTRLRANLRLYTPGEKTTAERGMQMEEQGGRMMELCGLVVRPHQKYLRLISTTPL